MTQETMKYDKIAQRFQQDPPLPPGEVKRRMPTLNLIESDFIRQEVLSLTQYAPDYFWTRPGSYSGHHNAFDHGLWFHTLKLSTVIERLQDTYTVRGTLTDTDIDQAHAAAILHDQYKNGADPESENTSEEHPLVAAQVVSSFSQLSYATARAIHEHMGPFDYEPDCSSELASLVHTADMIASGDMHIGVYGPVPEEIEQEIDPSVIEVLARYPHL